MNRKDGKTGLWLNDRFDKGFSGRCDTFMNESLTDDDNGTFEVLGVEVWRIPFWFLASRHVSTISIYCALADSSTWRRLARRATTRRKLLYTFSVFCKLYLINNRHLRPAPKFVSIGKQESIWDLGYTSYFILPISWASKHIQFPIIISTIYEYWLSSYSRSKLPYITYC